MNILLVCSAGMSTSILVRKMREQAVIQGLDVTIEAIPESELSHHLDQTDVILIGPQVRYLETKIRQVAEPKGVRVAIINQMAYGLMKGDLVLEQAQSLLTEA
ncbi:PTS sugar transporter subunit IIB [Exiguobacterium sp. Helios]|uniref:PTS sugar transporter subunit IIB n=1 Tax=unclassified Exiguobacterium TaxID=2644629 RepID=UPI00165E865B|nr:PTS sugar transporter subunit IIB [Exiguobacterium sp. Helios]QNR21037.1 PTS sugar transporter subunit IIB [Exiguobacterium sp. Helios]